MSKRLSKKKAYLGDAVYAEYVNGMIKLTTEVGTDIPTNTIFLEAEVVQALYIYIERLKNENLFRF